MKGFAICGGGAPGLRAHPLKSRSGHRGRQRAATGPLVGRLLAAGRPHCGLFLAASWPNSGPWLATFWPLDGLSLATISMVRLLHSATFNNKINLLTKHFRLEALREALTRGRRPKKSLQKPQGFHIAISGLVVKSVQLWPRSGFALLTALICRFATSSPKGRRR